MQKQMLVYTSSAGTGKTFTLAAYYISLLMQGESYRSLLAVTFTNKATAEMKERILTHLYFLSKCPEPTFLKEENGFIRKVRIFMAEAKAPALNIRPLEALIRQREATGDAAAAKAAEAAIDAWLEKNTLPQAEMFRKANEIFPEMIENYGDISVTTIDAFLQKLMAGLAQAIQAAAGYRVDLDTKHAISEAVDQLMSIHYGEQDGASKAIEDFINSRMEDEGNWDVRSNMRGLANELFQESVMEEYAKGRINDDREDAKRLRDAVDWRKAPELEELKALLAEIARHPSELAKMKTPGDWESHIGKIEKSIAGQLEKAADYFPPYGKRINGYISAGANTSEESVIYPLFLKMNGLCDAMRKRYLTDIVTCQYLYELVLLKYIRQQIADNQRESDTLLLADTARKLTEVMKTGDAPFLLEKMGIRYRHIMLDEFQDTSHLQWNNIEPLISELLAGGECSVLIVGDIKQSIYRWRNGDWHIMQDLPAKPLFAGRCDKRRLPRNFRSLPEVVRFNLQTMQHLLTECAPAGDEQIYRDIYDEGYRLNPDGTDNIHTFVPLGKRGGYVGIHAYPHTYAQDKSNARPKKKDIQALIIDDMLSTIGQLAAHGAKAKDCLILCRTNDEIRMIVSRFNESHKAIAGLADKGLSSSNALLLEASPSVNTVISAIRYRVRGDRAALLYAARTAGKEMEEMEAEMKTLYPHMPLLDMLEKIIGICLCNGNGQCTRTDLVYINALKDKVRSYIASYGADAEAFLTYYDDKMHGEAVPVPDDDNSVRIMTYHGAKGLESRYVFLPFCNIPLEKDKGMIWSKTPEGLPENYIPVNNTKNLPDAGYGEAYEKEHKEERIDNLNLLYVGITRAAEGLYLYIPQEFSSTGLPVETLGTCILRQRGMLADVTAGLNSSTSSEPFIPWQVGDDPLTLGSLEKPDQEKLESPLNPKETGSARSNHIATTYFSENRDIRFVQSQESEQYSLAGPQQGSRIIERIEFGNICHDVFAHMATRADEAAAIADFRRRGIIESDAMEQEVRKAIDRAWTDEQMCSWFDGSWDLLREEAILVHEAVEETNPATGLKVKKLKVREYRPDRVMLQGKQAIILDYKFGHEHEKQYAKQLRNYIRLLRDLKYTDVEAYLWYAQTPELKHVNEQPEANEQ